MSIEQEILNRYGYLGAFLNQPEIGPLLRYAAANGWTQEVLQGALFKTKWYQQTSNTARQWTLLQSADPAEAARVRAEKQNHIALMLSQAGIKATPDQLAYLTQAALWSGMEDELLKTVAMSIAQPANVGPGTLQSTSAQVQALAYEMLLPMTEATAFDWAKRIMAGNVTMDAAAMDIRNQAMSRFPQFADEITRGSSMKQIAAPYVEQTAKLLDVAPETIDMTKDKWSRMIDTRNDDGTRTSMSLADAATYVRRTDEWQYTDGAHEQAAAMATTIGKTFGKVA